MEKYQNWSASGSILGYLFFSIYVNERSEGLSTNEKLFSDNNSSFIVIHDTETNTNNLKNELYSRSYYTSLRIHLSAKTKQTLHLPLTFNSANVSQLSFQKHLCVIVDTNLIIDRHAKPYNFSKNYKMYYQDLH